MDAPGDDGNASILEQVKRPNPWRKMRYIYIYKFSPEQAMKAQRGVQVLLYSFFNLGARGVGGQRHAPATLPPGKRPGIHE